MLPLCPLFNAKLCPSHEISLAHDLDLVTAINRMAERGQEVKPPEILETRPRAKFFFLKHVVHGKNRKKTSKSDSLLRFLLKM